MTVSVHTLVKGKRYKVHSEDCCLHVEFVSEFVAWSGDPDYMPLTEWANGVHLEATNLDVTEA